MGFQLHLLSGVKEVFFFQFPKDLPLGLELSFRRAGDDDHPFTDVWAFCWGDLNGGPGESGQLFNVCPFLPDDGPHGLGRDEEIHDLLLWILEGQDETDVITPLRAASPGTHHYRPVAGSDMGFFVAWGTAGGKLEG